MRDSTSEENEMLSLIPTKESQNTWTVCKATKHNCNSTVLIDVADGL